MVDSGDKVPAYITLFPTPESYKYGIQRKENEENLAYLFWVKIGDTENDHKEKGDNRKDAYMRKNPPGSIKYIKMSLDGAEKGVGKVLETLTKLWDWEMGGIGQARTSEWHSVYASDAEQADKLGQALLDLEKKFANSVSIDDAVTNITEVLKMPPAKRKRVNGVKPAENVLSEGEPFCSILVVPSVHEDAYSEGIATQPDGASWVFWVKLEQFDGGGESIYKEVASPNITEMPDFAYNARKLKNKVGLKALGDELTTVIKYTGNNEMEDGKWQKFELAADQVKSLREYVAGFDKQPPA